MLILAIETATVEVGVAIAAESGPVATLTSRLGRRQVETLHPAIVDVCRTAGVELAELDAIAVDVGPGLFTGLRVGVAAAKALAGALGLPVVTATSLEVLRAGVPAGLGEVANVVPVVDMRRGEVAWLAPGAPPAAFGIGKPVELAGELAALAGAGRPALMLGDGALRYREELSRLVSPPLFAGTELAAPPVASLAVLAIAAMGAGLARDCALVRPLYGREADARINWSSRADRATAG